MNTNSSALYTEHRTGKYVRCANKRKQTAVYAAVQIVQKKQTAHRLDMNCLREFPFDVKLGWNCSL